MKINYFTYTIDFLAPGLKSKICISDILNLFCSYTQKQSELEKTIPNGKTLYFAKSIQPNVYYLLTPALLNDYKSLNKSKGVISDLQSYLGTDSLEKVTYIYVDPKEPVLGISSSLGGANVDDLTYYLDEVLNISNKSNEYQICLEPLSDSVKRTDITNLTLVTEAGVTLSDHSATKQKVCALFGLGSLDNAKIEIKIKRSNQNVNITKELTPLLKTLSGNQSKQQFMDAHLRAKRNHLQATIKDYQLDHSSILFDTVRPTSKRPVEEQIEEKASRNADIRQHAAEHFKNVYSNIKQQAHCGRWSKLQDKKTFV